MGEDCAIAGKGEALAKGLLLQVNMRLNCKSKWEMHAPCGQSGVGRKKKNEQFGTVSWPV